MGHTCSVLFYERYLDFHRQKGGGGFLYLVTRRGWFDGTLLSVKHCVDPKHGPVNIYWEKIRSIHATETLDVYKSVNTGDKTSICLVQVPKGTAPASWVIPDVLFSELCEDKGGCANIYTCSNA